MIVPQICLSALLGSVVRAEIIYNAYLKFVQLLGVRQVSVLDANRIMIVR